MLSRLLERLGFPSVGEHRRFVGAIAIDAIGSGVFLPVSILYFLATTPLPLVEVGLALSLAGAVGLPLGPVLGSLVDRYGARQVLLAGNALEAIGFVAYLWSESFVAVLGWTLVVTLGRMSFWASFPPTVALIAGPGERERWFGFLGALRNVGFAVGGLAAGGAITLGTEAAYSAVVAVNALTYAGAFVLLLGVPDRRPDPRSGPGAGPAAGGGVAGGWRAVLTDGPFRLLALVQLGYALTAMALNVAIPVYATRVLELPGWLTGAVFTLNTVMIGVGQGLVVRGLTGRVRARVLLVAHAVLALSFLLLLAAAGVPRVAAGVLVVLAVVVLTAGELLGGPVLDATAAEHAPAHERGRYLSVVQLAWNTASTVAPFTFAWLLDRGPGPLWLGLAAGAAATAILARRLERVLPAAAARVSTPAHTHADSAT